MDLTEAFMVAGQLLGLDERDSRKHFGIEMRLQLLKERELIQGDEVIYLLASEIECLALFQSRPTHLHQVG